MSLPARGLASSHAQALDLDAARLLRTLACLTRSAPMKGTEVTKSEQIKADMPVVCSENGQFATVDHVEGKSVKLTKDDKGQHHYIPLDWVKTIDDKVHIDRPGDKAMSDWSTKPLP
jgi:hypothetical protein